MDTQDLRSQLSPGWSPVNIVIMVVLLLLALPLGLLMLGYILAGEQLGLDLSRPDTFARQFQRLRRAVQAGIREFTRGAVANEGAVREPAPATDTPAQHQHDYERDRLDRDRQALDNERRQFEDEKRRFYENRDG